MNRNRKTVIAIVVAVFLMALAGCKIIVKPVDSTTGAPASAPSTSQTDTPNQPAATNPVDSDSTETLEITTPGVWDGQDHTVPRIVITADDVTVRGFVVSGGTGTGIEARGNNITIDSNTITNIKKGEDLDGIRFFGDNITIRNNLIKNLAPSYDMGGAHIDCMQTWASESTGPSNNIKIIGNKCLSGNKEMHQCFMAEGEGSEDGGGGTTEGPSTNFLIEGNEFNCFAGQTIALRDIHNVTIRNNNFTGAGNKAIQVADGSTVTVEGNKLGPGYKTLQGD